jgi:hypothetical protein
VLDVEVRDVGLVWKSGRQPLKSCSRTAQQLGDGVGASVRICDLHVRVKASMGSGSGLYGRLAGRRATTFCGLDRRRARCRAAACRNLDRRRGAQGGDPGRHRAGRRASA